ncbi:MAG: hypothetical protein COC15_00460 [Legionellales bacterium]|nr:MAG: hypothetical protein COC15_00460 [Legionellales bacterium]
MTNNSHPDKKYLFVIQSAFDERVLEASNSVLAASAFSSKVSVLFMGNGVMQITKQYTHPLYKDYQERYAAWKMYDIESILVSLQSLELFGLEKTDCSIQGVTYFNQSEIKQIMHDSDIIFHF